MRSHDQLGFIETAKDARDARKSLAKLTSAGHELVGDADGVVQDTVDNSPFDLNAEVLAPQC